MECLCTKETSNGLACLKSIEIREFYDLIGTSERNYAMAAISVYVYTYIYIYTEKQRGDRRDNTRNFYAP